MTNRIAEASPRFKARMAGVFQLLEGVTATYGEVIVLGNVVVAGNAAATAANILGYPGSRAVILAGVRTLAYRRRVPYRMGASHV